MRIGKRFFEKYADSVALKLLGKTLVRKAGRKYLRARIIETEAYFGSKDPASWARFNGECRKIMEMEAGTILVKMVHNNNLLNFVCGNEGKAGAVLIRAVKPINFLGRCNGPGLLTNCLKIDRNFNKKRIDKNEFIWIEDNNEKFRIRKSFRVGVTRDLKKHLRYFIDEE